MVCPLPLLSPHPFYSKIPPPPIDLSIPMTDDRKVDISHSCKRCDTGFIISVYHGVFYKNSSLFEKPLPLSLLGLRGLEGIDKVKRTPTTLHILFLILLFLPFTTFPNPYHPSLPLCILLPS